MFCPSKEHNWIQFVFTLRETFQIQTFWRIILITKELCLISEHWLWNLISFVLYFDDSIKQLIGLVSDRKDVPFWTWNCLISWNVGYSWKLKPYMEDYKNQFLHNSLQNVQQRQVDICSNCLHRKQDVITNWQLLTSAVRSSGEADHQR